MLHCGRIIRLHRLGAMVHLSVRIQGLRLIGLLGIHRHRGTPRVWSVIMAVIGIQGSLGVLRLWLRYSLVVSVVL